MQEELNYNIKLSDEQEELSSNFWSETMPSNATDRYKILIKYFGEYHFIDYRKSFLETSPSEEDLPSLLAAIQEIEDFRSHELLQDKNIDKLYTEAKGLLNRKILFEVKEKEKLSLLIFVLHHKKHFDSYTLPDEAFEFKPNGWDNISAVYGKYFRFYFYLRDLLGKVEPKLLEPVSPRGSTKIKKRKKITSFEDVFERDHRDKYHKIMKLLCEKMPIFTEIKTSGNSVVTESGNVYKWNRSIQPQKSYVCGILQYCYRTRNWIDGPTKKELQTALTKTFGVEFDSPTNIRKACDGELLDVYVKPFATLFQDIQ